MSGDQGGCRVGQRVLPIVLYTRTPNPLDIYLESLDAQYFIPSHSSKILSASICWAIIMCPDLLWVVTIVFEQDNPALALFLLLKRYRQ